MPLPKPKPDEERSEFIPRCMSSQIMEDEFPDSDQRVAVCSQLWRDRNKKELDNMDDKLYKLINLEIKESDDKERIITAIGSKQIIDRDGDIVDIKGIDTKKYKANPVVLWSHAYFDLPIGKGVGKKVWIDDDELKFKIQFAPEEISPKAGFVYNLYKEGYLKSFSIGFIPDYKEIEYVEETKKMPAHRLIKKSELLEISCVNVPANSAAVMAMANKAWDDGTIDGSDLQNIEEWCKNGECEINKDWIYDKKDWLYLVHHMHPNSKNVLNIEELHHCVLFSEKGMNGDEYEQKHIKNGKKHVHVIDTDNVKSVPKVLYDHINNGFKITKKTIDDEKYAVLTSIVDDEKSYEALEVKIAELKLQLKEEQNVEEDIESIYEEYFNELYDSKEDTLEEMLEEMLED